MSLPTTQRERIASLLAHGVQHGVIAAAVGLSPGRLTQLIEEDTALHALLEVEAAKKIDETIERELDLDKIERKLIGVLPTLVDECTSLGEGMRALAALVDIKARAKGFAPANSGQGIGVGVQVNLGNIANTKISVVLDQNRAILSLGGQDVTAMPRDTVEAFLEAAGDSNDQHDADVPQEPDPLRGALCAR